MYPITSRVNCTLPGFRPAGKLNVNHLMTFAACHPSQPHRNHVIVQGLPRRTLATLHHRTWPVGRNGTDFEKPPPTAPGVRQFSFESGQTASKNGRIWEIMGSDGENAVPSFPRRLPATTREVPGPAHGPRLGIPSRYPLVQMPLPCQIAHCR